MSGPSKLCPSDFSQARTKARVDPFTKAFRDGQAAILAKEEGHERLIALMKGFCDQVSRASGLVLAQSRGGCRGSGLVTARPHWDHEGKTRIVLLRWNEHDDSVTIEWKLEQRICRDLVQVQRVLEELLCHPGVASRLREMRQPRPKEPPRARTRDVRDDP
jgi:hypothetical protein